MAASDRRNEIVEYLRENARYVSSRQLSDRFAVAVSTIERDLVSLRNDGYAIVSQPGRSGGVILERDPSESLKPGSFVGRRNELGTLDSAFNSAESTGATVLISGVSGQGKSRLVREFGERCESSGARLLWGESTQNFYTPAFSPWISIIELSMQNGSKRDLVEAEALLNELTRESENTSFQKGQLSTATERFNLFRRMSTLLNDSADGPTVIVVDDLQLADDMSLAFMEFMSSAIRGKSVLLVGVYNNTAVKRGSAVSRTLSGLARSQSLVRISLKPLPESEVLELIDAESSQLIDVDMKSAISERSEGNPFFVKEIVQTIRTSQSINSRFEPSASISILEHEIPDGVRDVIGQRLDQLPAECNEMMRYAAIVGREFDTRILDGIIRSVDELRTVKLLDLMDQVVAAGLVTRINRTDTFRFDHALIHETIVDDVPLGDFASMQALVAREAEQFYGANAIDHSGELAARYLAAMPVVGSKKAIYYSMIAGRQAQLRFSYKEAAEQFKNVLDMHSGDFDPVTRHEALAGYGRAYAALASRGDKHKAVAILIEAVDFFVSTERVDRAAEIALTDVMPISSEPGDGTNISGMIERVVNLVPERSIIQGSLLSRLAVAVTTERYDFQAARIAALTAQSIAIENDDKAGKLASDRALVALRFRDGSSHAEFKPSVELLIRDAVQIGDTDTELRGRWYLATSLMSSGSPKEASRVTERFLERAEIYQETGNLQQAFFMQANLLMRFGEWAAARSVSQQSRQRFGTTGSMVNATRHIEIALGDKVIVEKIVEYVCTGPETFLEGFERMHSAILLYCNRPEAIISNIDIASLALANEPIYKTKNLHDQVTVSTLAALVACSTSDQQTMRDSYALLSEGNVPVLQNVGIHPQRLLMKLAVGMGDTEQALAHIDSALRYYDEGGCLPELAISIVEKAELDAGSFGSVEDYRLAIDRAKAIADSLEMTPLVERIHSMKSLPQLLDSSQDTNDLTPREVEVLRLVANGATNKAIGEQLFISENTVRRHVSHIFMKIEVSNRSEATGYVFRNQHLFQNLN